MINLNNDIKSHIFSFLPEPTPVLKVRRLEPDETGNFPDIQVDLATYSGRPLRILSADLANLMCVCKEFNSIIYEFYIEDVKKDIELRISHPGRDFRYLFCFQQKIGKAPSEFTDVDKLRFLNFLVRRARILASTPTQDESSTTISRDLQKLPLELRSMYWSTFVNYVLHSSRLTIDQSGEISFEEWEDIHFTAMLENSDLDLLVQLEDIGENGLNTVRQDLALFKEITILTDPHLNEESDYNNEYKLERWPVEVAYCKNLTSVCLRRVSIQAAKEWKKCFPKLQKISGILCLGEDLAEFKKFAHENRVWFGLQQELPDSRWIHFMGPYGYQDTFQVSIGEAEGIRAEFQTMYRTAKSFFWDTGCQGYDLYRQHSQVVVAIAVCMVAGAVLAATFTRSKM